MADEKGDSPLRGAGSRTRRQREMIAAFPVDK
jgi:hypothetical protein